MFGECLQFPINLLTNFQYDFGFDLPFLSNISLALMKNCSLAYFIILLTLFRWVLYLRRRKGELFCFTCLWSRSLRDRPFNLKGGYRFLFRSEIFFRTTQELEYLFFLSRRFYTCLKKCNNYSRLPNFWKCSSL